MSRFATASVESTSVPTDYVGDISRVFGCTNRNSKKPVRTTLNKNVERVGMFLKCSYRSSIIRTIYSHKRSLKCVKPNWTRLHRWPCPKTRLQGRRSWFLPKCCDHSDHDQRARPSRLADLRFLQFCRTILIKTIMWLSTTYSFWGGKLKTGLVRVDDKDGNNVTDNLVTLDR